MYRGEHVDILYGNVKHAFFQVNVLTSFLCNNNNINNNNNTNNELDFESLMSYSSGTVPY